ncbi:MAG: glycosyltransferase [archaeon]
MKFLKKYSEIIGEKEVNRIFEEATPLCSRHFVHINSTHYGGGVAEILNSLVYLMNDVGLKTGWRVIAGPWDFFEITKKFHNAMHGEKINLSPMKKRIHLKYNERNAFIQHIEDHDYVIVHDPQPVPLINYYDKKHTWIWRFHLDSSHPNREVWNYLKQFIEKYDAAIFSHEKFAQKLKIPHYIIYPSIDPLNEKNKEVKESKCRKFLSKRGVDFDKPIISMISRFDKWKDFPEMIKSFEKIKKEVDCRLVLLGNTADDDPEGKEIYDKIKKLANGNDSVLLLTENNSFLVNALQRSSEIVFQRSIKEGFALTVSEALWKETPVIASKVGGIPLQVLDGKTGYLTNNSDDTAKRAVKLLKNEKLRKQLGKQGKEHVRKNFLITRHLMDYIKLFKELELKKLKQ